MTSRAVRRCAGIKTGLIVHRHAQVVRWAREQAVCQLPLAVLIVTFISCVGYGGFYAGAKERTCVAMGRKAAPKSIRQP